MLKCDTCPCCPADDAYRTGAGNSKHPYEYLPYRRLLLAVEPREAEEADMLEKEAPSWLPEELTIVHIPDPILAAIELVVRPLHPNCSAKLSSK